jgi:glycosyltransferase involved in cell wall biosynthesis
MRYQGITGHTRELYLKYAIRQSALKADKIIADSMSTRDDLVEFWNIEPLKIRVIYPGLEKKFTLIKPSVISDFKRKKGLPDDFILFLGDLDKRKNLAMLIDAFYLFKKEFNMKVKLVIAGRHGNSFSELLSLIERKNLSKDVLLTGYFSSEEVPLLYSSAKIFVYPSLYEGFGFPVLESFACGTPVIASSSSSIPEVAGNAALLLSPFKPSPWASAIKELFSDREKREELIKKGLERAREFSWDKTARQVLAVYQEMSDQ